MELRPDRRCRTYEKTPEVWKALEAKAGPWLEMHFELARLFAEVEAKASYIGHSCAGTREYGRKIGYDGWEVQELTWLGLALARFPEVAEDIRGGRLTLRRAYDLGHLLQAGDVEKDPAAWLARAHEETDAQFKRSSRKRITEARELKEERDRLVEKTFLYTQEVADRFGLAGEILSKEAKRRLDP